MAHASCIKTRDKNRWHVNVDGRREIRKIMNFILTRRRTAAAAVGGLEICIWMELYRLQFDVFPYVGDT